MASLQEVAGGLRLALDQVERVAAAVVRARELVLDARRLMAGVTDGSCGLEAEAQEVDRAWAEVSHGGEEMLNELARVRLGIEELIRRVLGRDAATTSPASVTGPAPPSKVLLDAKWIGRQRTRLPSYVTSGVHVDLDGGSDLVQSGREPSGEHQAIADHLRGGGFPPSGPGRVTAGEHVEGKVAWRLRNSGDTHVDLIINNAMCGGPYSCRKLLPYILRPGQSMTVHDPTGTRTFHGRSTR